MPIRISSTGSFNNTDAFLKKMTSGDIFSVLNAAGRAGVDALAAATPVESGVAANSWSFSVKNDENGASIWWLNDNVEGGFPVVIGLQYGHGTGTGGYVAGRDFINPAIRPVFDVIAATVWREVTSA